MNEPIWLEVEGAVKRFAIPSGGIPNDEQRAILREAKAATVVIRTTPDGRKFDLYRCIMIPEQVCSPTWEHADEWRNQHPDHKVIVDV